MKLVMYWFCRDEIRILAHNRSIGYSFIVVDFPTSVLLILIPYLCMSQINKIGIYALFVGFISLGIGIFGSFAC